MARRKSGLGAFAGGMLAGAALGAAAGLLFAPRRGKETRRLTQRIVKKSVDALPNLVEGVANTAQTQATRISGAAAEQLLGTLERLRVAAAAGIAASQAIAQVSEEEGDGNDWDGISWDDSQFPIPAATPPYPNGPGAEGNGQIPKANMVVESHRP